MNSIDMQTEHTDRIQADSYVTMHYRLSLENGDEIVSTFDMNPAAFQLGSGQLSFNLEQCLIGLSAGDERHFVLPPESAFGAHNPALVKTVSPDAFNNTTLTVGQPIHLRSDNGVPYSGVLRALSDEEALIDFNHPLAGHTICFDVQIIGVL